MGKYIKALFIFLFWWIGVGTAIDIALALIGLEGLINYVIIIVFGVGVYYAIKVVRKAPKKKVDVKK